MGIVGAAVDTRAADRAKPLSSADVLLALLVTPVAVEDGEMSVTFRGTYSRE